LSSATFNHHIFKSLKTKKQNQMNKAELVDAMASEAKITKADASRALEAFMNVTSKTLKKGERVALIGFGTFTVAKRSARNGRNPQTGKPIKIAAKRVAKFKAGAELSAKVK
jgi:DNA-binding protein HU-beta